MDSDLLELAKEPRLDFMYCDKDVEVNDTLQSILFDSVNSTSVIIVATESKNLPIIQTKSSDVNYSKVHQSNVIGAKEGDRNNALSKYVQELMMKGYYEREAHSISLNWSQKCEPPIDFGEFERTFNSIWKHSESFTLYRTKDFRANFRNDIVFQEYLKMGDKDYFAVYMYLIYNINDEDKCTMLKNGEEVLIKRNQIVATAGRIAEKLNIKTKGGNNNVHKVRKIINDLVDKQRFTKEVINKGYITKSITILTWIHFDFTQE